MRKLIDFALFLMALATVQPGSTFSQQTVTAEFVATEVAPHSNVIMEFHLEDPDDKYESTRIASIFGNYSLVTRADVLVSGFSVKLNPYRACNKETKGRHDKTLRNRIAVVNMSLVPDIITGCVSEENQVKFAEESCARAVILAPVNDDAMRRLSKNKLLSASTPVIFVNNEQTVKMNKVLEKSKDFRVHIRAYSTNSIYRPASPLDEEPEFVPSVFDIGIFLALVVLAVFVAVIIFIKVKWRPRTNREITLRTLAKSALGDMEVRKYRHSRRRHRVDKKRWPTAVESALLHNSLKLTTESLCASKVSVVSHNMCAICLEDYQDGQDVRVLSCAHEFHRKCVDPWILLHRTCPLCQFDVVLGCYSGSESKDLSEVLNCLTSPNSVLPTPASAVQVGARRSLNSHQHMNDVEAATNLIEAAQQQQHLDPCVIVAEKQDETINGSADNAQVIQQTASAGRRTKRQRRRSFSNAQRRALRVNHRRFTSNNPAIGAATHIHCRFNPTMPYVTSLHNEKSDGYLSDISSAETVKTGRDANECNGQMPKAASQDDDSVVLFTLPNKKERHKIVNRSTKPSPTKSPDEKTLNNIKFPVVHRHRNQMDINVQRKTDRDSHFPSVVTTRNQRLLDRQTHSSPFSVATTNRVDSSQANYVHL